jgi:type IV secretory pathway TrbL component
MPVNSVSSVVSQAATGYVKRTAASTSGTSGTSSAMQEATETASTTKQEAAHGDRVAQRKLAREQQTQQLTNPTPAPGKGSIVDQHA